MSIANTDNKGFLIAVVLVLALAVFSGSLRGKYSTGAAQYGTPTYGSHGDTCEEQCFYQRTICQENAQRVSNPIYRSQNYESIKFACTQEYKDCIRSC